MSDFNTNISYTNKDFPSIYTEILETVPKLTNKWDPNNSNESDPGVVLLKSQASMADKNNYYIDKAALEHYPQSVTQFGNAQKIYDSLGFHMPWYQSAICTLGITWTYTDETKNSTVTIPQYSMVSSDDGLYTYTLLNTVILTKDENFKTVSAIEGKYNKFQINGQDNILLENLDSDRKIYFEQTTIAENGIFVKNAGYEDEWRQVYNLESTPLGSKVYTFGILPNSNTCYLQFPQDIGNLIEDGLNVSYVISTGSAGNITARTLNKFLQDIYNSDETVVTDQISIQNTTAGENGQEPVSLDEAYRLYKKTAGTFDTLVTCRDYENAVFTGTLNKNAIVSNDIVSDRTNDITRSQIVKTNKILGVDETLISVPDETLITIPSANNNTMNAYTLGLYVLNPVVSLRTAEDYKKSFKTSLDTFSNVVDYLESTDRKSIQHDFLDNINNYQDKYIFKNYYSLIGTVTTYTQVTSEEAKNIQDNIKLALFKSFNARAIDFGQEISYEDIYNVIQSADKRIKSVRLSDFTFRPAVMASNNKEYFLDSFSYDSNDPNDLISWILAKNILAGKVPYYNFNNIFSYKFDTNISNEVNNISQITSEVVITLPPQTSYQLRKNESIICYAPNFETKVNIAAYLYYKFTAPSQANNTLAADSIYELKDTDSLLFFKDKESFRLGNEESATYKFSKGDLIKPNFAVTFTSGVASGNLGADKQFNLVQEKAVDLFQPNLIGNGALSCYWIVNNSDGVLFGGEDYPQYDVDEKLLDAGEYFIYTDAKKSNLYILGSGTLLKRTSLGRTYQAIKLDSQTALSNDEILDKGLDIPWQQIFVGEYTASSLKAVEQQLITLGEGTILKNDTSSSDSFIFSNESININDDFQYYIGNQVSKLPSILVNGSEITWKGISKLAVIGDKDTPLVLEDYSSNNVSAIQTISLTDAEGVTTYPPLQNTNILFSNVVALPGGENQDTRTLTDSGTLTAELQALVYTQPTIIVSPAKITEDYSIYTIQNSIPLSLLYPLSGASSMRIRGLTSQSDDSYICESNINPYYIEMLSGSNTVESVFYFQYKTPSSSSDVNLKVSFDPSSRNLMFELVGTGITTGNILISKINRVEGSINENISEIDDRIAEIFSGNSDVFDYTYQVKEEDKVDYPSASEWIKIDNSNKSTYFYNIFKSSELFNKNNVLNRYTIAEIDSLDIKVSENSKIKG